MLNLNSRKLKLTKSHIVWIILFVVLNSLTLLCVIPYAQRTANAHMNAGPFLGIVYILISLVIFLYGINYLVKTRNFAAFIMMCLIIVTLCYWSIKLYNLFCLACAVSG